MAPTQKQVDGKIKSFFNAVGKADQKAIEKHFEAYIGMIKENTGYTQKKSFLTALSNLEYMNQYGKDNISLPYKYSTWGEVASIFNKPHLLPFALKQAAKSEDATPCQKAYINVAKKLGITKAKI